MANIKTDTNTSKAFDQDLKANISCVIHNTCDVAKSRWSIHDPTDLT